MSAAYVAWHAGAFFVGIACGLLIGLLVGARLP